MPGKLFIVATPIGNLKDITLRALETLRSCDIVVCEDTRVTSKLLTAHEISKPLRTLHEHTTHAGLDRLIKEITDGKNVAYVSDAGTPGVNDPGGKFVEAAAKANISIEPIPGVSALTTAISVSGFPMDDFTYLGFVPHKKGRQTFFKEIAECKTPSVFFESTHRIAKALESLAETLPDTRQVCIGRELTKFHETVYRGNAKDVQKAINATSSKGEFVVIVGPAPKR